MPESADIATRVAAIRAGAEVRAALGQAAQYAPLPDGRHRVSIYDRSAGRLLVGTGATLSEAIQNVREEPHT
ncbi:MAG: hypothetical protein ABSG68_19505 [Thermoguttaceae bacterium]|jgi:hypothetical protein